MGQIEAKPGATNVIAAEARVTLDVRHKSNDIRDGAVDALVRQAHEIAERRGLTLRQSVLLSQRAVTMDPFLVDQIQEAIRSTGCQPHRMTSGAGHDAMILAEKVPAAMIFLRRPAESATIRRNQSKSRTWPKRSNAACICSINLQIPPNFKKGCAVHNPLYNLGQTRSAQKHNHLLLTPDTFVRTTLPGMKACAAIVHAGPAIGARFAQYTAEFESGGELGATTAQRFLYVLEGQLKIEVDGRQNDLATRGYAYLPEGARIGSWQRNRAASLSSRSFTSRLLLSNRHANHFQ